MIIKTDSEMELMRGSGQVTARILNQLAEAVDPGTTTREIDKLARALVAKERVKAAFLGYNEYPASVCVSVNEEVVHGIPGKRRIEAGDVVSLDFGIVKDGYYGDMALTVIAGGRGSPEDEALIRVTREALMKGIGQAVVGNRLSDISHAIQTHVEAAGLSVVRQYVGHGIGTKMHESPQLPNFGEPHRGPELKKGMVLAIEPMVNIGTYEVEVLADGWTVVTRDRKRSAHFEHTVAITEFGPKILTADEG